jgi:hypothetical protein
VGSKPGTSRFQLFSHFHHFTAEPQTLVAAFSQKEVARRWGANPGPLNFIYFLIFTTLPLSHKLEWQLTAKCSPLRAL